LGAIPKTYLPTTDIAVNHANFLQLMRRLETTLNSQGNNIIPLDSLAPVFAGDTYEITASGPTHCKQVLVHQPGRPKRGAAARYLAHPDHCGPHRWSRAGNVRDGHHQHFAACQVPSKEKERHQLENIAHFGLRRLLKKRRYIPMSDLQRLLMATTFYYGGC